MNSIKRYIKLYIDFTIINFKSIMNYKLDFLFGIISMFIKNAVNFFILLFIFNIIKTLKGWNFNQILFLYGFSTITYAIWHCFFINTISLPYYLKTGKFDSFLLKPVNSLFLIMTDSFDEDGWGELIFGIIIVVIAIYRLKIFNLYLLFLPVLFISGALVYAGLSLITASFSFISISQQGFTKLVMNLNNFSKYPLTIYPYFIKLLFTIIIPVGFCAFYPSLFFITGLKSKLFFVFISPFVSILFFIISIKIWKFFMQFYKSSGS